MKNELFYQFQKTNILNGLEKLADNIKLILYQNDSTVFDRIDFNADRAYLEPLLFAFFNSSKGRSESLESLLFGYVKPALRPKQIEVVSDRNGRIYLPNFGWLLTEYQNFKFILVFDKDGTVSLYNDKNKMGHTFESIEFVENTNIEILKYPVPLLEQFYFDVNGAIIDVEIENITRKHKAHLAEAYGLLRKYVAKHFELIELACPKCIIFNVDTYLRNSFATLSAQGISFFNAYQDDYNEVFFVDDIAHQTGHVIFNALIYEVENFLLVNQETILQNVEVEHIVVETRNIHVIFHALYTYHITFNCLTSCLEADCFKGEKYHEALGRIRYYIDKCYQDLLLIDNPIESDEVSRHIFTEDGLIIYQEVKETFKSMVSKWGSLVKGFNLTNQPYNFTYSKFIELNPLP